MTQNLLWIALAQDGWRDRHEPDLVYRRSMRIDGLPLAYRRLARRWLSNYYDAHDLFPAELRKKQTEETR